MSAANSRGPLTSSPSYRRLRGYAFDPSLSLRLETVSINSMVYRVPWEELKPGPVGEYVAVIDHDPSAKGFYAPVNLNDPELLAQDGLPPSESNPQFHQQMVYAVAMTTIRNFERALGRKIMWSARSAAPNRVGEKFVQQLRLHPHALRDANAYYSPRKKAVLFGYFESNPAPSVSQMPSAVVCTCLSHDIIAHELTHAILDGMHYHYNEATNPDVLAFHEAFSDIVALFQHFTFPDVLKHQIASSRGDLASQNLLGQLAQEFGTAIGHYGSLRDAIGRSDEDGVWRPAKPDPTALAQVMEPHARGSILVAAIFEAFLTIYKTRIADLLRIATNGTGVKPEGELHPDLVNRLADEAAKAASHVLAMCIRALDYCPPVDITFGDYLRAIITADHDLFPNDGRHYRLAFIDAFRKRGIFPQGVVTFSEDSLRFSRPAALEGELKELLEDKIGGFLRDFRTAVTYVTDREDLDRIAREYVRGGSEQGLHKRIARKLESAEFERLTGLVFRPGWDQLGVRTSQTYGIGPSFQVQNLRVVSRSGEPDSARNMIVFALVQRCGVIVRKGRVTGHYVPDNKPAPEGGFEFRGGCTMIFDLDTLQLRYSVTKPLLRFDSTYPLGAIDEKRVLGQHRYQRGEGLLAMDEHSRFFGRGLQGAAAEPFALLHLG